MLNYLMKTRQGQFLLIGILFTILGFIFTPINDSYSQISFYIAIFFLGLLLQKMQC